MTAPSARLPTGFHLFTGRDVPWLVDERARTRPDNVFLVWEPFDGPSRSWTFAEFARETAAYAAGLAAWGICKGDFVAIHLDNCPEFLFAWYGCSRLGAVAVTTNTRSTRDELGYFLEHSGAIAAITQPRYLDLVRTSAPQIERVACIGDDAGEAVAAPPGAGAVAFETLRGDPEAAPRRAPEPLLANSVQYTSGTTSRPKGVVWTHANALWSGRTTTAHAGLTEQDVHLVHLPLFHTAALGYSMLGTLWSGGTAVLMPRFSASRFWDVAVRHRCTWTFALGFHLRALGSLPAPENHCFAFWLAGGDLSLVRERWGIKTIGWYGMTETIAQTITYSRTLVGREFSMGLPAAEYENAIRRSDGSEVAFGETGHLWVRGIAGISLFQAYLHNPEATAAAFDPQGWFSTGDLVTPQDDGFVFFASRDKDMLKVGGENVAAIEIESVIAQVPGVIEVAVVGRPDPVYDEVPVACIVAAEPGAALECEIMDACRLKLSKFKQPRQVMFLAELPKGLLDKVLKRELRAHVLTLDAVTG
ncbi:AMP-binding protein [Chelatococcus reniformis]|uniref:ATP-dependent acyl-CoA ligase n=1 Tax=Chelatococcus reniformis TaxID=1494448 RepID=A0A916UU55_9HYPH|nr:AMP-binding protein [Chelatococcus reniformis]GGC88058.1 ATP-dependent acyl-CoA ligase [Chelatococcus reniformis]